MNLRIAVLQHERETGLGAFVSVLDEGGIDCELLQTNGSAHLADATHFNGVIVLGGSIAATDAALVDTRRWIRNVVLQGTPYLGVCLGGQLLATALGSFVVRASPPEAGVHDVFLTNGARHDPLFCELPGRFPVFGWHEDAFELPRGAVPLAGSIACEHQAFRFGASGYGLQFHPEGRPHDLGRWPAVPGYADLLKRVGANWDDLTTELARATPALDHLVEELLGRWLDLATELTLRRERTQVAV
jgi:GMP synthase-like glutamine amidotransferase